MRTSDFMPHDKLISKLSQGRYVNLKILMSFTASYATVCVIRSAFIVVVS